MPTTATPPQRLLSIDLLRGLTVMLMIMVNAGIGDMFPCFVHAYWTGFTLADCVMPSFLFIMGASTYLSLRKYGFQWSRAAATKIVRRTLILFLLGLFVNWLGPALDGRPLDFAHLRIWGVMQRIAICYCLTAIVALSARRGALLIAIVGLVAYAFFIKMCGGYSEDISQNFLAYFDVLLLGENHLIFYPFEPEGFFSNLSAVLTSLIGFYTMEKLSEISDLKKKLFFLATIGVAGIIIGLIITPWFPLSKKIWSPSFVLLNAGIAQLALCLLMALVDWHKPQNNSHQKETPLLGISTLLQAFGTNPLLLYVGSEVLIIAFWSWGIAERGYEGLLALVGNGHWASLIYMVLVTAIFGIIGLVLHHKRIFVKI